MFFVVISEGRQYSCQNQLFLTRGKRERDPVQFHDLLVFFDPGFLAMEVNFRKENKRFGQVYLSHNST